MPDLRLTIPTLGRHAVWGITKKIPSVRMAELKGARLAGREIRIVRVHEAGIWAARQTLTSRIEVTMSTKHPNRETPQNGINGDQSAGYNRRRFIGAGATLLASTVATGARGQDIEKITAAQHDESASNPGPENADIQKVSQNSFLPPPTDHGEVPAFWNTFSTAHRRVQQGGWTRQVTIEDFPISKDIAGVNMRLIPGGIRELHWHQAAEWAIMLSGNARITALDDDGRAFVKDVTKDDLWFFPPGNPHSIQGLAPDGCEFLLVFDDGHFSEGNTTLISDWARHTPRDVLAKNWGVPEAALDGIYAAPAEGRFIFKTALPRPLEEEQRDAAGAKGLSKIDFGFPLHSMKPTFLNESGEVRIIDTRNFPISKTVASAHVIVKPGAMREIALAPERR
jgi:oxalate decarboxylase